MKGFIILLIVTALFICGCSDSGDNSNLDENQFEQSTEFEETDSLYESDSLPDNMNFNGAIVKIFWWEELEEFKTEFDGDIVNDSLYMRDRNVEDRLNVLIENVPMSYTWTTRNVYIDSIRATVLSDDNSKDIVSGQYATMPSLVPEGFLMNLVRLPYLDFTKPWWVQGLIEETTIDSKLYLVSGSYTMQAVKGVYSIYFNKALHNNLGLDDMYMLVHDGKWVFDKMLEMINDTYIDLNGNGTADMEDQYGFIANSGNSVTPFIQGFDLKITTMNNAGYPEMSMNTDKWINAVELMCDFFHTNPNAMMGKIDDNSGDFDKMYMNNQILFYSNTFNFANTLKDMENDFGIIPIPKWNEAQDDYYTAIGESNSLFGIVSNCREPETVAATMEALYSESYRTVTPALYETALKIKYSRDDETALMFDIIREGIVFNFGSIYTFDMEELNTRFKAALEQNNKNWASTVAGFEKSAVEKINIYIDKVINLED